MTQNNLPLSGKRAFITGASSGFGLAIAHTLAGAGADLLLLARGEERLAKAAAELAAKHPGVRIESLAADVTDPATFERAADVLNDSFGGLDILINNAGAGIAIAELLSQSAEDIEQSLQVNLHSAIHACRILSPLLVEQKSGLIINVSSACAKFAWPGWSVYSAAKAGLGMFSRCLYAELRPSGVAVTHLVPGGSNTGFHEAAGIAPMDEAAERSLRPEHIAHAVLAAATLPPGGVIPEIVVYGQSQEIIPF